MRFLWDNYIKAFDNLPLLMTYKDINGGKKKKPPQGRLN
jgi:hypothetical protein